MVTREDYFNVTVFSVLCSRKKCLLVNNVFLMAGALFAVTSRVARSFEMIIISRILVGINCGMVIKLVIQ